MYFVFADVDVSLMLDFFEDLKLLSMKYTENVKKSGGQNIFRLVSFVSVSAE